MIGDRDLPFSTSWTSRSLRTVILQEFFRLGTRSPCCRADCKLQSVQNVRFAREHSVVFMRDAKKNLCWNSSFEAGQGCSMLRMFSSAIDLECHIDDIIAICSTEHFLSKKNTCACSWHSSIYCTVTILIVVKGCITKASFWPSGFFNCRNVTCAHYEYNHYHPSHLGSLDYMGVTSRVID